MSKRPALLVAAQLAIIAACGMGSAGCEWVILATAMADDDPCDGDPCCEDPCCFDSCVDPVEAVPPEVAIAIADWPPIGPTGSVSAVAHSDAGLSTATFFFKNQVFVAMTGGTDETASASGSQLGEGMGTLTVDVTGFDQAITRRTVENLLVDLGAPTTYVDDTVLPAAGSELRFWIADAWVVSGYELTLDDSSMFTAQLEPGYPSTLGVEWDFSLVSIPVEELPLGTSNASLRVWDAAGNETTVDMPFTIDGVPPTIAISEPLDGAEVSGSFHVTATASDDNPFPVSINLYLGGTLVGTGVAPSATVTLNADEFPLGPIELSAVAVDRAGNESPISAQSITIAPAAEP